MDNINNQLPNLDNLTIHQPITKNDGFITYFKQLRRTDLCSKIFRKYLFK